MYLCKDNELINKNKKVMKSKIRVRFAPSPTGPLHIGGVRTALYNYLFAKQNNGTFILRIEDTDANRFVPGAQDYIIKSLNWCGIKPDEGVSVGGEYGPYIQSERKDLYKKYTDVLLENGNAYYAFDTAEELDNIRNEYQNNKKTFQYDATTRGKMKNSFTLSKEKVDELINSGAEYVVRFKMPDDELVVMNDIIRGEVKVNTSTLDDKVLYKSDGMPTYHLANIVDDYLMKISHVIRGEEWLPSLPLHVLLYRAFGWENEMPQFAHLPLLLKPSGKGKLSKRDGDKLGFPVFPLRWPQDPNQEEIASGYKESGYYPEAFINMLAFLGWNPGTEQEIFSMEELINSFSIEHVGKSGSRFDPEKAHWFNHQYLINKSDEEIAKDAIPYLHGYENKYDNYTIIKICGLVKDRLSFVKDIWNQVFFFFEAPTEYAEKPVRKRWKEGTSELMIKLIDIIDDVADFKSEVLEEKVKQWIEDNELNLGAIFNSIRISLVGDSLGPGIFDIMEIIGKEESISRIKTAAEKINK